ncbi:MAG: hypothetical protein WCO18_00665 [bacterium]
MKKVLISGVVVLGPLLAFAQNFTSVQSGISSIRDIINSLIPLIIGIAVLVFLWGLVQYVTAGADEEKKAAARGIIIYGIIIIFVMTAVWGFVRILSTTFFGGVDTSSRVQGPTI